MVIKNYRVVIGRLIDVHFETEENARSFIEGFNYARRQRDEILYEFKNKFKTRGFRFAINIIAWLKKHNASHEWYEARPCLTIIKNNGSSIDGSGSLATTQPNSTLDPISGAPPNK